MSVPVPIDLDLALDGYLTSADGRLRRIGGLDRIAEDLVACGATVQWAEALGTEYGRCYCETRVITLVPSLFDAEATLIRRVLTHEVSHLHVGHCERKARRWQTTHYGDLLQVWCAILLLVCGGYSRVQAQATAARAGRHGEVRRGFRRGGHHRMGGFADEYRTTQSKKSGPRPTFPQALVSVPGTTALHGQRLG